MKEIKLKVRSGMPGASKADSQADVVEKIAQFVEDSDYDRRSADKGEWSCHSLAEEIRERWAGNSQITPGHLQGYLGVNGWEWLGEIWRTGGIFGPQVAVTSHQEDVEREIFILAKAEGRTVADLKAAIRTVTRT